MSAAVWSDSLLGEVITLQRGFDITKKEQRPGPYPVISSSGPASSHDQFKVEGPGVVIGRKGSLGGVYYSDTAFWPHDTTLWVKDFQGNVPRFVYYWLQTLGLEHFDVGASNPTLNRNHLHLLPVRVADVQTQAVIASVLADYDELIENNTRRIQILEEMAQAIYREWFVEFGYPGHEDVPLLDSDLGPIPEGWRVVAVSDVATIVRGRSYRKDEIPESGGVPFLNLKCMERGGGFRKSGLKRYTGKFKPSQEARPGDIVIAVTDMTQERNVVARAARVPTLGEEFGVISLDLARVVPDDLESTFLYGMFRYSGFAEVVKNYANGANVLHLSPDRIAEYRFLRAAPVVERAFVERVEPMYQLIDQLQLQDENLRTTGDLLLPRLISGEVDVSDLDIDVGDAAA